MSRAKNWCFTLNNHTQHERESIATLGSLPAVKYLIVGRETGDNGTPHLQGYIQLAQRRRLTGPTGVRNLLGLERAHFEVARGSPKQASDYCKKDGDFDEYGELQETQGRRSDWDNLRAFVTDLGSVPSNRVLASDFTALYARYRSTIREICASYLPTPELVQGSPHEGWQSELWSLIQEECTDTRTVRFYVDYAGNKGKSWFCAYALSKLPDRVQVLSVGKRDDLAYAVDESKDVFLFDIPRGQLEFVQYAVLEKLKDRMIFSPKYCSGVKILRKIPHVVLFTNEDPDQRQMSSDRWNVTIV